MFADPVFWLTYLLLQIRTFFLHPGENRAGVIAKVDAQLYELVRTWYIGYGFNSADAHVNLFEHLNIDEWLYRGRYQMHRTPDRQPGWNPQVDGIAYIKLSQTAIDTNIASRFWRLRAIGSSILKYMWIGDAIQTQIP